MKDSLLFTPACTSKRSLPPRQLDSMPPTFATGFGCTKLAKLRLAGDFIFPPMAARAKFNKYDCGPVLEAGLYSLVMHLNRYKSSPSPRKLGMVACPKRSSWKSG